MVGFEKDHGFLGLEARYWGTPGNQIGFIEAIAETEFRGVDVSLTAGTGFSGNDYWSVGVAVEHHLSDRFSLVGGLGIDGNSGNTWTMVALGGSYAVNDRVSVTGIYGIERDRKYR